MVFRWVFLDQNPSGFHGVCFIPAEVQQNSQFKHECRMFRTDQLEVWGWLEKGSRVSAVGAEAPPISSVMREKSLLRLVTLPRSLDPGANRTGSEFHPSNQTPHNRTKQLSLGSLFYFILFYKRVSFFLTNVIVQENMHESDEGAAVL